MGEVQFITHYTAHCSYVDSARLALEGGCRWIQLRMKETPVADIEPIAREVQQLCRHYHATFLIDDQVELVRRLRNAFTCCRPTASTWARTTCR